MTKDIDRYLETDGLDTDRYFYGLSVDIGSIAKSWDFTVYGIEQRIDGVTDRRAVGAEARYLSENDDVVFGNAYRDVLLGDGGNDELRGLSKSDLLNGGLGDDRLLGGPGSDQIFGGSGSDVIHGGWGHDEIRPGSGDDRVRGGYGSDLFVIGSGDDVIEDFRVADYDKIGIRDFMDYSLAQIDNDLRISTEIGNTILYGVDQSSFDAATLIVNV